MSDDARFEDGREAPLNLGALDADDLQVISSLVQDAVFPMTEMTWQAGQRRFALLLNRFRWEDDGRERHGPERVRALLVVDNVLRISSQGIDRRDKDLILSLLSVTYEPVEDGAGHVTLTLGGRWSDPAVGGSAGGDFEGRDPTLLCALEENPRSQYLRLVAPRLRASLGGGPAGRVTARSDGRI